MFISIFLILYLYFFNNNVTKPHEVNKTGLKKNTSQKLPENEAAKQYFINITKVKQQNLSYECFGECNYANGVILVAEFSRDNTVSKIVLNKKYIKVNKNKFYIKYSFDKELPPGNYCVTIFYFSKIQKLKTDSPSFFEKSYKFYIRKKEYSEVFYKEKKIIDNLFKKIDELYVTLKNHFYSAQKSGRLQRWLYKKKVREKNLLKLKKFEQKYSNKNICTFFYYPYKDIYPLFNLLEDMEQLCFMILKGHNIKKFNNLNLEFTMHFLKSKARFNYETLLLAPDNSVLLEKNLKELGQFLYKNSIKGKLNQKILKKSQFIIDSIIELNDIYETITNSKKKLGSKSPLIFYSFENLVNSVILSKTGLRQKKYIYFFALCVCETFFRRITKKAVFIDSKTKILQFPGAYSQFLKYSINIKLLKKFLKKDIQLIHSKIKFLESNDKIIDKYKIDEIIASALEKQTNRQKMFRLYNFENIESLKSRYNLICAYFISLCSQWQNNSNQIKSDIKNIKKEIKIFFDMVESY